MAGPEPGAGESASEEDGGDRVDGLDGLLVVDKPGGLTSHDVVQAVRRAARLRRIGHGGTLDPLATGVLPLLLGVATRLARFLPSDPKVYAVTARLGVETTTGDGDGEPLAPAATVTVSDAALEAALDALRGPQMQVPPMFSAKKLAGQRLYRLARRGEVVARAAVPITVHALRRLARSGDEVQLEVSCSPGTYVRSLVVDLGRSLGCGASVTALRRLRSGEFTAAGAVPLARLVDRAAVRAARLPLDLVPLTVAPLPLRSDQEQAFRTGRTIPLVATTAAGTYAARSSDGRLLGVGEVQLLAGGGSVLNPFLVLHSK